MDLDTIIYIIATIVIFIVSLLGQKKKKKDVPVQSDTDDAMYSLNDFEKILKRKEEFEQYQEVEKEEIQVEEPYVTHEIEEKKYHEEDVERVEKRMRKKKRKKKKMVSI